MSNRIDGSLVETRWHELERNAFAALFDVLLQILLRAHLVTIDLENRVARVDQTCNRND